MTTEEFDEEEEVPGIVHSGEDSSEKGLEVSPNSHERRHQTIVDCHGGTLVSGVDSPRPPTRLPLSLHEDFLNSCPYLTKRRSHSSILLHSTLSCFTDDRVSLLRKLIVVDIGHRLLQFLRRFSDTIVFVPTISFRSQFLRVRT